METNTASVGARLGLSGTLEFKDKDGNEKYTTEIVANEMQMLGGRSSGGNFEKSAPPAESGGGQQKAPARRPAADENFVDDDIPF